MGFLSKIKNKLGLIFGQDYEQKEKVEYAEFIFGLLFINTMKSNNNQYIRWYIEGGILDVMTHDEYNKIMKPIIDKRKKTGWTPPTDCDKYIVTLAENYIFSTPTNIKQRADRAITMVLAIPFLTFAAMSLMNNDCDGKYDK